MADNDAPDAEATTEPALTVTERRWRWLIGFYGLTAEDLELLAEAAPLVRLDNEVANSFYEHVLAYPELSELIRSTTTIDRLRCRLKQYFRSLFVGRFDDARVEELARIARAHDRIGLPFTTYLGATLRIDRVMIPALVERYKHDPALLSRALMAYRKLSTSDLAIVAQTFWDTRATTTAALVQGVAA